LQDFKRLLNPFLSYSFASPAYKVGLEDVVIIERITNQTYFISSHINWYKTATLEEYPIDRIFLKLFPVNDLNWTGILTSEMP